MVNILKLLIMGLFCGLVVACSTTPNVNQQVVSVNDPIINVETTMTNELSNRLEYLAALNISLPQNWQLDTIQKMIFNFLNEQGENGGYISTMPYNDNFDYPKPNHSSVINDEYILISFGKCRLITLDADNGSAASGLTGTHNEYYAVIPIKDKVNFILNFNKNDKDEHSKEQFIELLKSLNFK